MLDHTERLPTADMLHLPHPSGVVSDRLPWPAAAAVIIGGSGLLWMLITLAASQLGLF